MAEVDAPAQPQDWSPLDRSTFTERWNRANVLNLLRGAAGAEEYRTIAQRAAFYDWFDQIRDVQGHPGVLMAWAGRQAVQGCSAHRESIAIRDQLLLPLARSSATVSAMMNLA